MDPGQFEEFLLAHSKIPSDTQIFPGLDEEDKINEVPVPQSFTDGSIMWTDAWYKLQEPNKGKEGYAATAELEAFNFIADSPTNDRVSQGFSIGIDLTQPSSLDQNLGEETWIGDNVTNSTASIVIADPIQDGPSSSWDTVFKLSPRNWPVLDDVDLDQLMGFESLGDLNNIGYFLTPESGPLVLSQHSLEMSSNPGKINEPDQATVACNSFEDSATMSLARSSEPMVPAHSPSSLESADFFDQAMTSFGALVTRLGPNASKQPVLALRGQVSNPEDNQSLAKAWSDETGTPYRNEPPSLDPRQSVATSQSTLKRPRSRPEKPNAAPAPATIDRAGTSGESLAAPVPQPLLPPKQRRRSAATSPAVAGRAHRPAKKRPSNNPSMPPSPPTPEPPATQEFALADTAHQGTPNCRALQDGHPQLESEDEVQPSKQPKGAPLAGDNPGATPLPEELTPEQLEARHALMDSQMPQPWALEIHTASNHSPPSTPGGKSSEKTINYTLWSPGMADRLAARIAARNPQNKPKDRPKQPLRSGAEILGINGLNCIWHKSTTRSGIVLILCNRCLISKDEYNKRPAPRVCDCYHVNVYLWSRVKPIRSKLVCDAAASMCARYPIIKESEHAVNWWVEGMLHSVSDSITKFFGP